MNNQERHRASVVAAIQGYFVGQGSMGRPRGRSARLDDVGQQAGKARAYYDAEAKKRQEESRAKPGQKIGEGGGNVSTTLVTAKARDQAGKAVGVSDTVDCSYSG